MRWLIIGILLLLIGTTIAPASNYTNKNTIDQKSKIKTLDRRIYNLIGGVIVTFDYLMKDNSVKFQWWTTNNTNLSYPIINNNVSVNYTIKLQAYAIGVYFIPRLVKLLSTLYYDVNTSRGSSWTSWKIVRFTNTTPGIEEYVYVETTTPFPTPPSDPGTNSTKMWIYSNIWAITIPPDRGEEENRPFFIHTKGRSMNFTATFYEI